MIDKEASVAKETSSKGAQDGNLMDVDEEV